MRYEAGETVAVEQMTIYSESDGLHFMLNFTVALALLIGIALWWLSRRGRVLWLQVWSIGLVIFSIAYLGAAAVGAGFGISLCCDVRIVAESARMGSIFIKRALASDYGVAYWLPRLIGMGRAQHMLLTGEAVPAQTALDWGLVTKVVPAGTALGA